MKGFPAGVADQLGWYVYLYRDPRDGEIFYVGKGQGNRVFAHLEDASETEKVERIAAIRDAGDKPQLEILRHNLADEKTALLIESVMIDAIGIPPLTNRVGGYGSRAFGRMTIEKITAQYAKPVKISPKHKVILIRVNQRFYHGMTATELYDSTRGIWKVGERAHNAEYAFAVYKGVVREVYRIDRWHRAGSTKYTTRPMKEVKDTTRREFTGEIAEESVRRKYLLKSVENFFGHNWQTPFVYVNC